MNFKTIENIKENSKKILLLSKDQISRKKISFGDFGLKKEILWGIYEIGYKNPSPVQEESIPKILEGKDIIARAKNGTGKTAAFVIPVLQKVRYEIIKIQSLTSDMWPV